jgi:hypothetical protein
MKNYITKTGFWVFLIVINGCGITTKPSLQNLQSPSYFPTDLLTNDILKPDDAKYGMSQICGYLLAKNPNGLYYSTGIPAFTPDKRPTLTVLKTGDAQKFHGLFDSRNIAVLKAAYGPAAGSVDVQGDNRIEVTVNNVSVCKAEDTDVDTLKKAVDKLYDSGMDVSDAVYATVATHSELKRNNLTFVSANARMAATPIINFEGNNYSKETLDTTKDFISVLAVPLMKVRKPTAGQSVQATPLDAKPVPGTAVSGVLPNITIVPAVPVEIKAVTPEDLQKAVENANKDSQLNVTEK